MKARLFLLTAALALLGWQLGFAADKPELPAVHVIVVWVNDKSGDIEFTEHAGIAQSADRCGQMTLKEVAPHIRDYAKNAKQWTAHIICGVAQDHYIARQGDSAPAEQGNPEDSEDDPHGSHPGTGGDQPSSAPVKAAVIWMLAPAFVAGIVLAFVLSRPDPWALQHKHPPHDSLGMGQQEGRGQYGASGGTPVQSGNADDCMQRGGTPYWVSIDEHNYKLTCVLGNAVGVTTP